MDKCRVFLGAAAVVPRADIKRHMERPVEGLSSDHSLQAHLEDALALPKVPDGSNFGKHDYVIDVFVAKHQAGEVFDFALGDYGFPLLWRPAVEVRSRLISLRSKKTVTIQRVIKKMGWSEFLNKSCSFRGYFGFKSPFTQQDMLRLLDEALIEALEKSKARL